MSERERGPRIQLDGPRCPYCHDEVPRGEPPAVCSACHALHHAECYQQHGACSACGEAAPAAAGPERSRPGEGVARGRGPQPEPTPLDPEGRVKLDGFVAELRELLDTSIYRRWWLFLLPHLYIPLFWPFLLHGLNMEKKRALRLAERARSLLAAYGAEASPAQLTVLLEGDRWGRSGVLDWLVPPAGRAASRSAVRRVKPAPRTELDGDSKLARDD